jgi:microcystin-dependent protein
MSVTAKGIPYPAGGDNNNAPTWFNSLATWIDDYLTGKTTAQIDALSGAARWTGRMVFNTDTKQVEVWNGARWAVVGTSVGEIVWLAGDPTAGQSRGLLAADGTAQSRTTYADLFARIGTLHGVGDGSTTFNLPNLKGRAVWGLDAAQTEFNVLGETGGAKTVTIQVGHLPAHNHTLNITSAFEAAHQHTVPAGTVTIKGGTATDTAVASGAGMLTGAAGGHAHMVSGTTDNAGGSTPLPILPPYIVLKAYIRT